MSKNFNQVEGGANLLLPKIKKSLEDQEINETTLRRVNSRGNHLDSKYIGTVNENFEKDGHGIKIYPEDSFLDQYEGQWKDGNYHGYGVLKFRNGESYDGHFSNGTFDGKGTFNYDDGSKYEGEWVRGQKNGQGVYVYDDGSALSGSFENDVISGIVHISYDDGGTYTGYYENNQIDGKGRMEYASKDCYEGRFSQEVKQGFGMYRWEEGSIYVGSWNWDQPHGFGISVDCNQEVHFCTYSFGQKIRHFNHHLFYNEESKLKFIEKLNKIIDREI